MKNCLADSHVFLWYGESSTIPDDLPCDCGAVTWGSLKEKEESGSFERMREVLDSASVPTESRMIAKTDIFGTRVYQITDENGNPLDPPLEHK